MNETTMESMKTVMKELQEYNEHKRRIEAVRKEHIELAQELKRLSESILAIAKRIDPVLTMQKVNASRINYDSIIQELYDLMISGTQVSITLIEKTYPDFNHNNHQYVMRTLATKPHVMKRREGMFVYLYYHMV